MISDHIEALFLKKQELIKLAENQALEQILKSDKCSIAQLWVYNEIESQIKRIDSAIRAAYSNNSELDNGTQFKIFDRVQNKMNDIDPEERAFDKLMDLIKSEKTEAILENE